MVIKTYIPKNPNNEKYLIKKTRFAFPIKVKKKSETSSFSTTLNYSRPYLLFQIKLSTFYEHRIANRIPIPPYYFKQNFLIY